MAVRFEDPKRVTEKHKKEIEGFLAAGFMISNGWQSGDGEKKKITNVNFPLGTKSNEYDLRSFAQHETVISYVKPGNKKHYTCSIMEWIKWAGKDSTIVEILPEAAPSVTDRLAAARVEAMKTKPEVTKIPKEGDHKWVDSKGKKKS